MPARASLTNAWPRSFPPKSYPCSGWLAAQPNFTVLEVAHTSGLADPIKAAAQVNHFVGGHLNEHAMAAVIDPALGIETAAMPDSGAR